MAVASCSVRVGDHGRALLLPRSSYDGDAGARESREQGDEAAEEARGLEEVPGPQEVQQVGVDGGQPHDRARQRGRRAVHGDEEHAVVRVAGREEQVQQVGHLDEVHGDVRALLGARNALEGRGFWEGGCRPLKVWRATPSRRGCGLA